jgi:hypothetical protein
MGLGIHTRANRPHRNSCVGIMASDDEIKRAILKEALSSGRF